MYGINSCNRVYDSSKEKILQNLNIIEKTKTKTKTKILQFKNEITLH